MEISPDHTRLSFALKSILIFNPKFLPLSQKPSESDYQDAKLLYYYPELTIIEEKRNQVGLAEGTYHFWSMFEGEKSKNSSFQMIYSQDYVHIMKEMEENYFILMILKPIENSLRFQNNETSYMNSEVWDFESFNLEEENCKKLIDHFYCSFRMFYGCFADYFIDEINSKKNEFNFLMSNFVNMWININSSNIDKSLNILKYNISGLNYSPIEKKKFLSMQYLLNLLRTIEPGICNSALFYNGYFINSSFTHQEISLLYDYFYVNSNSADINTNKINKMNLPNGNNLIYGYLLKNQKFLMGPIGLEESKELQMFTPYIYMDKKYKLIAFLSQNLLVLLFFNYDYNFEKNRLIELQNALNTNLPKLTNQMDKQLARIQNQQEIYKMVYFNGINLAIKVSNKFNLNELDYENLKIIDRIKNWLEKHQKNKIWLQKTNQFWIFGYKGNERITLLFINGGINFNKLEEEKEIIIKSFFGNIYI